MREEADEVALEMKMKAAKRVCVRARAHADGVQMCQSDVSTHVMLKSNQKNISARVLCCAC